MSTLPTAPPQTSPRIPFDKASYRARQKRNYEYPSFVKPIVKHPTLATVALPRIRQNCLLIKVYRPQGFTKSGLYVEPRRGPAIWGHVLAFNTGLERYIHRFISVGDMILFHRYADDVIMKAGDLTLSLVHIKNVQVLFTPPLVEMSYNV